MSVDISVAKLNLQETNVISLFALHGMYYSTSRGPCQDNIAHVIQRKVALAWLFLPSISGVLIRPY